MSDWYQRFAEDVAARKTGVDPRPKRYIEARLKKTSAKKAAQMAGYTGRAARAPFKLIETPELKRQMQEALQVHDVGLDRIAATLANSLKANVIATTKDGEVIESEVADHKVRLKGAEAGAKLWGLGDQQRQDQAGSTIVINLNAALTERYIQANVEQTATKTGTVIDAKL